MSSGMAQGSDQFARLSPRMRDCLRLVYERKSSKEIALLLSTPAQPLMESTVSGYIADAVRLLGARNRKDAAERLHAHEAGAPDNSTPANLGVAASLPPNADDGQREPASAAYLLPFRTRGVVGNDLSIRQRVSWIFLIALGVALGIGAVASALQFVNGVVLGHR